MPFSSELYPTNSNQKQKVVLIMSLHLSHFVHHHKMHNQTPETDRSNTKPYTVKREMLVAIIFGGFENITIWLRFNLEILLEESGWGPYFFHLATTNFGEIY